MRRWCRGRLPVASRAGARPGSPGSADAADRRQAGLTLIEMVVALGIVALVLVSAGTAFTAALSSQRFTESHDRAVQVAQDYLQRLLKVPFSRLGVYANDPGYQRVVGGELTVTLGATRPPSAPVWMAPTFLTSADPTQSNSVTYQNHGNPFRVQESITWVQDPANGLNPAGGGGQPSYGYKRITITVSWADQTRTHTVTAEDVRAPNSGEAIPPAAGSGIGSGCDLSAPDCSAYVTSGEVLANSPGFPTTVPIEFTAVTTQPASGVTATFGSTTLNLVSLDGGYTWNAAIPAGTANELLPGNRAVTFTTTVGASTYTGTYVAAWRMPITPPLSITPVGLLVDTTDAHPGGNGFTGGETFQTGTGAVLCVRPSGQLWHATAVVFDVHNIDDMDGAPSIRFGWSNPALGPFPLPGETAGGVPIDGTLANTAFWDGISGPGGYIGPRSTAPGGLNTLRYWRAWPQGTLFGQGQSVVTITAIRPGDGAQTAGQYTLPIVTTTSAASCP